jgi:hypothetical protein
MTMAGNDDDKTDYGFPDQKSPPKGTYDGWDEEHGIFHGLTEEEALDELIASARELHVKIANNDTHFDRRWGHILQNPKAKAPSGNANDSRDAKTKAADEDAKIKATNRDAKTKVAGGDAKTKTADKNQT